MRIVLDEADFADLVAGRTVLYKDGPIEIRLADVGFERMEAHITTAIEEQDRAAADQDADALHAEREGNG